MVELNGSRIAALRSQDGEFGMIAFKTVDVADKAGGTPARREVRVALRAIRVARGGKSNRSPMIGVAGSACGRERLRCVMHGAVMAREALLVDDLCCRKNPGWTEWQAEHCLVRTACAVDKLPAEYTRRSLRTPYHAIPKMASAGAATESKNRQRRSGLDLLK